MGYTQALTEKSARDRNRKMFVESRTRPVSYGDSFTFICVDDVRSSQETHLWASRLVTGIALLFICRKYLYLTGNTCGSVAGVAILLIM
jgi:hypothetical protein